MKTQTKLIGSAANLKQMQDLLVKYFCGSAVTLSKASDGVYWVATGKGIVEGCQVREVRGRFRFEMVGA